jgi:hypothetical protein
LVTIFGVKNTLIPCHLAQIFFSTCSTEKWFSIYCSIIYSSKKGQHSTFPPLFF